MKNASLIIGATLALGLSAFIGCGSDTVQTPTGGTSTTTTTTGTGGAGGGSTTSAGGAGGTGGEGGGMGGAGGAGGGVVCEAVPTDCGTCLYTMCQDLYCECYGNQECVDLLFTCLSQCAAGDTMCSQDCAAQYPGGVSDAALLGGCSDQNCAVDCPMSGIVVNECTECLFTSCDTEMNACFENPECVAILDCAQQCPAGDGQCPQDCAFMYPGGLQPALGVFNCANANCDMQCPL